MIETPKKSIHFIFAVDESGSMTYEDAFPEGDKYIHKFLNRYGTVLQVCVEFAKSRNKHPHDVYTFLTHDDNLKEICVEVSDVEKFENIVLNYNPTNGGNNFQQVFKQLLQISEKNFSTLTNSTHEQVLIFIGDGGDDSIDDSDIQSLVSTRKFIVYTVMIGTDNKGKVALKHIAEVAFKAGRPHLCEADHSCQSSFGDCEKCKVCSKCTGKFIESALDFQSITAALSQISASKQ